MLDLDDYTFMYETLDYEDEYTGAKYFTFFDKRTKSLQCDNCRDLKSWNKSDYIRPELLNPAKIPKGERLPCCDESLCVLRIHTQGRKRATGEDESSQRRRNKFPCM